jgi:GNAT superfamily N-acetyltransferase
MKRETYEERGMHTNDYYVSTDVRALNLVWVVASLRSTYWGSWRSEDVIVDSIRHSMCFGLYYHEGGRVPDVQVGFARVVTDHATFSWVCDVYVDPFHRGRGLGKFLMRVVTNHPAVKKTVSVLGTRDAHGLYEKFGYKRHEYMRRIPGEKK